MRIDQHPSKHKYIDINTNFLFYRNIYHTKTCYERPSNPEHPRKSALEYPKLQATKGQNERKCCSRGYLTEKLT